MNKEDRKSDGSDLIDRGLILEIYISVDTEGNVATTNRGAPCQSFQKMKKAYQAAVLEINEFIDRGPRDCPFSNESIGDVSE